MENVRIKSGDLRYFTYGVGTSTTTSMTTSSTVNSLTTHPNAQHQDSPYATFQLISAGAATTIIEATNEDLSALNQVGSTPTNNNWVPITGNSTTSTISLAAAGTAGISVSGVPWRWVRSRVLFASSLTYTIMGV